MKNRAGLLEDRGSVLNDSMIRWTGCDGTFKLETIPRPYIFRPSHMDLC